MKRPPSIIPDEDGVTRYRLQFTKSKPISAPFIGEINGWRTLFRKLGWIGQQKGRYQGVGFGNISRRRSVSSFVVTGTQTGRRRKLTNRHYSIVRRCHPKQNRVIALGPVPPSSESMTHAMIYKLDPTANVVIHVHAPELWNAARRLGIPVTSARVPYGTPEMAAEVARLYRVANLKAKRIFSMGGHRDGVVSFGRTADEAGSRLLLYGLMRRAAKTLRP